jgi:multicomponent K+:H+ antiporter subunit E
MRRLVPYPLMTAFLIGMWLVLQYPFSAGDVVVGSAVALVASWATSFLQPVKTKIHFTRAIPHLALLVLADIIRSNIAVGRIILSRRAVQERTAGFILVPLELRSRTGLAVLAIMITSTPGTLWMEHNPSRNTLLIHVLDLVDREHWIKLIKGRYERLLLEIFE